MERIWQCKEKGYIFPIKNIGKQDQGTVKSELDMLYVEGKAEKRFLHIVFHMRRPPYLMKRKGNF